MDTRYVLISPVHNEEKYIINLMESIIAQEIKPQRWVLVNDRSTDNTEAIAKEYENAYEFITCYTLDSVDTSTYYARRTHAFLYGYKKVISESFDFVGCLDVDITMQPDYYRKILQEFHHNKLLGVASGVYMDKVGSQLRTIHRADISTPGAIQMFRHECYEAIGGYRPLRYGGDDALADVMARKLGWQTRSFPKYKVIHHRPSGTGDGSSLMAARYRQGLTDFGLGSHMLFMLAKAISRSVYEKPLVIGSMIRLAGYFSAYIRNEPRQIPEDIVTYLQGEQLERLRNVFLMR